MTTIIVSPTGEEIFRIDGRMVCRSSSPEQCREEDPVIIGALIEAYKRKGYRIKRLESLGDIMRGKKAMWEKEHEAG